MLEFHSVTLEDKEWITEIFKKYKRLPCEYSFGNIFSYTAKMRLEIADVDDCFVSRCFTGDTIGYCYPVGKGDVNKVLDLIIEDMKMQSAPCYLFGVGNNEAEVLRNQNLIT